MGTSEWKRRTFRVLDLFAPTIPFRYLPPKQSVRMAFNVILNREPDAAGGAEYAAKLARGELSRHGVAQALAHSEEFRRQVPISDVLLSMHVSRSEFVAGLPRASHILDLGGTHQGLADGALVHLGYPYRFERLVVVDLPVEERHAIYQSGSRGATVESELGPVEFAFHSMVDLSAYADGSFDMVYSGQSIEHVTEPEGDAVISVLRALVEHFSDRPHLIAETGGVAESDLLAGGEDAVRAAVTYVAGMTDRFAFRQAVALLGWDPDKLPVGVDS